MCMLRDGLRDERIFLQTPSAASRGSAHVNKLTYKAYMRGERQPNDLLDYQRYRRSGALISGPIAAGTMIIMRNEHTGYHYFYVT